MPLSHGPTLPAACDVVRCRLPHGSLQRPAHPRWSHAVLCRCLSGKEKNHRLKKLMQLTIKHPSNLLYHAECWVSCNYTTSEAAQTSLSEDISRGRASCLAQFHSKFILLMVQKSGDHQLRLVVDIPLFTRFWDTSQVVVWDFFHQLYKFLFAVYLCNLPRNHFLWHHLLFVPASDQTAAPEQYGWYESKKASAGRTLGMWSNPSSNLVYLHAVCIWLKIRDPKFHQKKPPKINHWTFL